MAHANLAAELPRLAALANQPRRDRGLTRAIYSYPAKFQAHLPAELIRVFTRPGDLVVDPYAGGGTTGLEAFALGRHFIGVDLNPFACLISRVKTTPVSAPVLEAALTRVLACRRSRPVLDAEDVRCLGPAVASEVDRLAAGTDELGHADAQDVMRLALIHAVKIAGRRDFDGDSVVPLFRKRVARIAAALEELPRARPAPRFHRGRSDHVPGVADGEAALVVTSPPYKDLDVEYGLLQIQRPRLGRSKRSRMIWALLGEPALGKSELCGRRGAGYFVALKPALAEIRRVLAPGAPAFFWIGFKSDGDRDQFVACLHDAGLIVRHLIPVRLGSDRVASSRSTHHGRATGMMSRDYLVACG